MAYKSILSGYDYSLINESYFLFNNQFPFGPVQLLLNNEQGKITYLDYENKVKASLAPFGTGKVRIAYFSVPGTGEQ